jgi:diguanylate cyclase (GGDEF)-like protein/PAS domain S-box-containing protein
MSLTREQRQRRFARAAVVCGGIVAAVGVMVLVVGWWLDVTSVRQPLVDFPAMRAATAAGLALAGLGVVAVGTGARPRWWAALAGAGVASIGVVAGIAYLAGQPKSWLESALAVDTTRDAVVEGRVAVNTAVALVLAGCALLLLSARRAPGLRQGLGLTVFLIAYTAVLGYSAATVEVAGGLGPTFTAMAPHTALPMLLVGFGLVSVDLSRGWASIMVGPLAGGRALRLAMPLLLVLFVLASLLYAVLGPARTSGGLVLAFVAISVVIGLVVLATRLERVDTARHALATDLEARLATQQLDARQASSLLRAQFDAAPDGVVIVGHDGRILDANAAAVRITGRSAADLSGARLDDLVVPEDATRVMAAMRAAADSPELPTPADLQLATSSGRRTWVRLSFGVMREDDGSPLLLVAMLSDVTDRLDAERSLRDSEELLRVVLDGSADIVVRLDSDLRIEYVNQRAVSVSGIPAREWLGRTFVDLGYPAELVSSWDERHHRVLGTGEPDAYEFEIDNQEGHRWYESSVAPVRASDGSVAHIVITSRDVTERKRAEADLIVLATRDPLTQLANRAQLHAELALALSASRRSGLETAAVMIDLDHFKYINDSLGHAVGDDLLRLVAERLTATVRGADLVGRLGGDEFLIVMRDLEDPGEAVRVGWRVVTAFRAPFRLDGRDLYTTATVGVAVSGEESAPEDLIREADTAMYVAKAEGRDRVAVFDQEVAVAVTARMELEARLRGALGAGEFELWYQPEVDLSTGLIVAVEGLLRWRRPDGEVVGADAFVTVAEEAGLIVDIGRWVLQQACLDGARWQAERADQPLIVRANVSAHQLSSATLLRDLDAALDASGLPPRLLCLEVTETALLRQAAAVADNFAGIRARSVRIALDDFGTGYASLAYLRDLTVDIVKIDRSFVRDVPDSEIASRLVAGIVSFASSLGIGVTAEGIETVEQAEFLRRAGCPSGQGYLFSRAVPAADIDGMLAAGAPAGAFRTEG